MQTWPESLAHSVQGEVLTAPRPKITLMIPWLAKSDQKAIFPTGVTFDSPEEQEDYVRKWAEKRTGFESNFKVTFYPGRYAPEKGSILPVGDPTAYISDSEVSRTPLSAQHLEKLTILWSESAVIAVLVLLLAETGLIAAQ